MMKSIHTTELLPIWLRAQEGQGCCHLIDVREPAEYARAHIAGARLMPLRTVPEAAHEIPKDEPVYLICAGGMRSAQAAQWLARTQGHQNLVNIEGGMMAWMQAGQPVVTGMEGNND